MAQLIISWNLLATAAVESRSNMELLHSRLCKFACNLLMPVGGETSRKARFTQSFDLMALEHTFSLFTHH